MSKSPQDRFITQNEGKGAAINVGKINPRIKAKIGTTHISWQIVALAITGFLLARAEILGGLYPFIPAFLAVTAMTYKKQGVYILIPIFIGFLTVMGAQQVLVYSALVILLAIIFSIYSFDLRRQWIMAPLTVFTVTLVVKGLFLVFSGFSNYLLLVGVVESAFAAGMTVVFLVIVRALRRLEGGRRFSADEISCFFVLAMGLISGLSGWRIGALDMQSVFSRFLIMAVAYLAGGGAGAGIGAMIGIVPSLSSIVAPSVVATYAFSGLLSGLFSNFGRLGTVMGFFLGNLILSLYLLDMTEISSSLGASAVAAIIFFLVPKSFYQKLRFAFSSATIKTAQEEKYEHLLRFSVRRLRNASVVFNSLGHSLGAMLQEEAKNPEEDQNFQTIINHLSRHLCNQCSMRKICWELDQHHTYKGIMRLFAAIEQRGEGNIKDIPENFSKRCPHIKELLALSNCLYEMYCNNNYWQVQRENLRHLVSRQLLGVSQVLENVAKDVGDHSEQREILEKDLARALGKRGLPVENAGIFKITTKSMDVFVQFSECPGFNLCRQAVEDEISRMTGRHYDVHEFRCSPSDCAERCRYRLLADGAFSLSIGKAQLSKDSKSVCGDCSGHILLEEGRELLMICDGMGVGRKAALESDTALTLVSRLIEAGFWQDTAIDTVDAAMSLRTDRESFVTMDLCLIDLYNGRGEFIKSGGSPSFIKRGHQVKVIKSESLPIGMVMAMEKEVITEQILPGDMVILASDGLLDIDLADDGKWLSRILQQSEIDSAQELAEYLLHKAIAVSGSKIKDDITILVAKMHAA
jgi:stage II sporulation protein E